MTSGWVHYPDNALLGYQLENPGDGGVNVAMAMLVVIAGGGPEDPVTDGIAADLLLGDAGLGVDAAEEAAGSGRIFYGTPEGQLIEAPAGYEPLDAENGQGLVLRPEGQPVGDNGDIIRWGEPNARNPDGYFRYYNAKGQPLNPATGGTGPNSATHIPPNYQGPLNGYPGR